MQIELQNGQINYILRNWESSFQTRPILFLHSALSTHKEFDKISAFYQSQKQIHLDLPGHGESVASNSELTVGQLAENVRSLLKEIETYSVDIIGYSLGGYVGLELALIAPNIVNSIVCHAMKFYWDDKAIEQSLRQLDVQKIKERSQKGFDLLSTIHAENGLEKTIAVNRHIVENFRKEQLREEDIQKIQSPILFSVGDKDELVSLSEIIKLYESQDRKKTYLAIHPNSPHAISKIDFNSFIHSIREFWKLV